MFVSMYVCTEQNGTEKHWLLVKNQFLSICTNDKYPW